MINTLPNSSPLTRSDCRGQARFSAQHLFPGRKSLRVRDVAQALGISRQQVLDLIQEYRDTDGRSGLRAIDVSSGLHNHGTDGRARRCQWRIPVVDFDAFVRARGNHQPLEIGRPVVAEPS